MLPASNGEFLPPPPTEAQRRVMALQDEAATLRARVKRIEDDYGQGEIGARVMREQITRQQVELDGITRRLAAVTRSSRLAA